MQDGKCLCGWCGNQDHTTGDACCPGLAASKKKLEDRQKKAHAKKQKKILELTSKVQSANDGIRAAMALGDTHTRKKTTVYFAAASPEESRQPTPPSSSGPRRLRSPSIKIAAHAVLSIDTSPSTNQSETLQPEKSNNKAEGHEPTSQPDGTRVGTPNSIAAQRKLAISDFPKLLKASNNLYAKYQNALESKDAQTLPAIKVEDVRKGTFTDGLADQYRHEMVRKAKRLSSMEQYVGVRAKVLDEITAVREDGDSHEHCRVPRKPKIPKPSRRLVNPKTKQPRPDRFNRKINRMMRKIWRKDHPLPVVEESLRDP
jgi:hypothetical protein